MKSDITASVVITCYNLEKYIGGAIDSVLAQDCNENVEIIVVDDASTDKSVEIIGRYPSVRLVNLASNSGVLLATVAGLRCCTGDLIFFLDGDDLWLPCKLRVCIDAFKRDDNVAFVSHDLNFIDANDRKIKRRSRPKDVLTGLNNLAKAKAIKNGILNHSDYVWLGSAYSLRRSKVKLEKFCVWAENLANARQTYQDWPLAYWCASIDSVKCAYVDQTLMSYRVHGANYSGDARSVGKALTNLRKGYFTAAAICKICQVRGLRGYPFWLSQGKELYYSCMIDLYCDRRLWAAIKFARLQAYLVLSSTPFLKEWARFLAISFLGAEKFTLSLKG